MNSNNSSNRNNVSSNEHSPPTQEQIFGTLFQDAMDSTKFIRITKELDDKQVSCRIFFGKNKDSLVFNGVSTLPKSLFYFGEPRSYGFNVARDPLPPKPDYRRKRFEDEYDDG